MYKKYSLSHCYDTFTYAIVYNLIGLMLMKSINEPVDVFTAG